MSVIYDTTLKNTRLAAVVTRLGATAKMQLLSAADVLVAEWSLNNPVGTVAAGVLTFDMTGVEDTSANATDEITKAKILDSAGTPVEAITGLTVGTSGTDVIIDNPSVVAGQKVVAGASTITHG